MAKEINARDYVAEFLANGGTVQVIPAGQRSDPATIVQTYGGRSRKKVEPTAEANISEEKK